jgi:hypothetical protein
MMDKKLTLVHNDKIALEKETDINFDLLDFSLKNKLIYNNSFQQFFFIIETESFIM